MEKLPGDIGQHSALATQVEGERRRTLTVIEGKLKLLKERIHSARVLNPKDQAKDEVRFGATVSLQNSNNKTKQQFTIVGVDEADVIKSKIAFVAPIARAVTGATMGQTVDFKLGNEIISQRQKLLPQLAPRIITAHQRIAPESEALSVEYVPSVKLDFADELERIAERERKMGSTLIGPHRDELALLLDSKPAVDFASEGQKRSIAIALKIAQAEHLTDSHGAPPVLLIDDVMGELDIERRKGFLPLLEECGGGRGQVFMTCTEENWPNELGPSLQRWHISEGTIHPEL